MTERPTAEELRKLKEDGLSDSAIAAKYRVQQTTVTQWRKKMGIAALRPARPAQMLSVSAAIARRDALLPQARELLSQGHTRREVAKLLDMAESTLRAWLKGEFGRPPNQVETYAQMVYDALVAYKYQRNGNSPTRDEMAKMLNLSPGSVENAVAFLIQQGRIRRPVKSAARGLEVVGSQWIPPTNWKLPARLRTKEKERKTTVARRMELAQAGRLCECGREAKWFTPIVIGGGGNRSARADNMILCDDCADYEREYNSNVYPIEAEARVKVAR